MVVHRLLAAAIGLERLPDQARDCDALRALCDNLNARHRNAQMAGRASVELHTLIFFRERQVVADARITKVRASDIYLAFCVDNPTALRPVRPLLELSHHEIAIHMEHQALAAAIAGSSLSESGEVEQHAPQLHAGCASRQRPFLRLGSCYLLHALPSTFKVGVSVPFAAHRGWHSNFVMLGHV